MNFVEELRWRGMIHDMMPGTEEQLQKEMTSAYVGIDPTADSLHIGHLVSVMMLKHLQRAGHRPIALVGGATGMIGDPSMKSAERNLLDEATLRHKASPSGHRFSESEPAYGCCRKNAPIALCPYKAPFLSFCVWKMGSNCNDNYSSLNCHGKEPCACP